jgi:uncharacterized protein YndB with AHSA1/START domain
MTTPTLLEHPSDREIQLTRLLEAPRDLVWEVVTDPAHAALWFGPEGFSTTTHEFEFRVGGAWRFTMHGPDGTDYYNKQLFREIAPKERIAYHQTGGLVHEDEGGFDTIITLAAEGAKTRITLRTIFPTAEVLQQMTEQFGVVEGGKEHLGRLAGYLSLPRAKKLVVFSRILPAPRALVWKTLTTPEGMMKWFSPKGWTTPQATSDLRVGGRWSVIHRGSDGADYENAGKYLEIAPETRLAFSWIIESTPGVVAVEAHQHLSLLPAGRETRLTFVARIITAGPGSEYFMSGVDQGWAQALDKLSAAF